MQALSKWRTQMLKAVGFRSVYWHKIQTFFKRVEELWSLRY